MSDKKYPEGEPNENWTVPQLKAYAEDNSIDLSEAKVKKDMLTLVGVVETPSLEDKKANEEYSMEQLEELSNDYFKRHATRDILFATADATFFFKSNHARDRAQHLKDKTVYTFKR